MAEANLYIDRIDWKRYLPPGLCNRCGQEGCRDLVDRIREGREGELPCELDGALKARLKRVTNLAGQMPPVPMVTVPQSVEPCLVPLNSPSEDSPVLFSANNEFTQAVVMAVLARTTSPFWVVFADTRGDTVDMTIILGDATAESIWKDATRLGLAENSSGTLILPGLWAEFAEPLAGISGRRVEVGPVCIAELPLALASHWRWAD
ncbi:MAG: hypothetical protein D6806_12260 [Deltaproteobacteria bacterium]|nr:MAG: hypothetical protein D6806_12260 [Deltaproteobacteria bacterium]